VSDACVATADCALRANTSSANRSIAELYASAHSIGPMWPAVGIICAWAPGARSAIARPASGRVTKSRPPMKTRAGMVKRDRSAVASHRIIAKLPLACTAGEFRVASNDTCSN